jgi:hypothetical protein
MEYAPPPPIRRVGRGELKRLIASEITEGAKSEHAEQQRQDPLSNPSGSIVRFLLHGSKAKLLFSSTPEADRDGRAAVAMWLSQTQIASAARTPTDAIS